MEWMLMPLRRYAEFSGRSRRREYWMFTLFQVIVAVVVQSMIMTFGGAALVGGDPASMMAAGGAVFLIICLYLLFVLAMFIPSLAVGVRRLHDTGRSGWWLLAPLIGYLIVFVGFGVSMSSPDAPGGGGTLMLVGGVLVFGLAVALLVFTLLDGTRGPNKYGPDPKGETRSEAFA